MAVAVFPGEGEDDALGCDDFLVGAALPIDHAVGGPHRDAVGATAPDVHLTVFSGEAFGSPPLRDLFGCRPGLKDAGAGGVEHAHQYECPVINAIHRAHGESLLRPMWRGTLPGGRGSGPRTCDSNRASSSLPSGVRPPTGAGAIGRSVPSRSSRHAPAPSGAWKLPAATC